MTSSLELLPATIEGLQQIINNLGEVGRHEYAAEIASGDWSEVFWGFGESECTMMMQAGEAICVMGHAPERAGARQVWTIYRDEYLATGLTGIRMSRRLMERTVDEYGVELRSYTASSHPRLKRWMALLGFRHDALVAGYEVFVLKA